MSSANKLGADRSLAGLVPAMVTLVSIAVVWIFMGEEAAFLWTNFAFAVFTGLALVAWWRTRSKGYLASSIYLLACTLMIAVRNGLIPGGHDVAPAFAILVFLSLGVLVLMMLTRQIKWRGRDVLELAARPVAGETEAFSDRPRPVGKADYSAGEIRDFAAFARRKQIAMTYEEADRVVFVPVKMGSEYSFLFRTDRDYSGDTWIAFSNDGNITVNVSESDYGAFREDLDHDQLCRSLADVFFDFLDMHRKGQDGRILDRLDAMKIGIFS